MFLNFVNYLKLVIFNCFNKYSWYIFKLLQLESFPSSCNNHQKFPISRSCLLRSLYYSLLIKSIFINFSTKIDFLKRHKSFKYEIFSSKNLFSFLIIKSKHYFNLLMSEIITLVMLAGTSNIIWNQTNQKLFRMLVMINEVPVACTSANHSAYFIHYEIKFDEDWLYVKKWHPLLSVR